MRIWDEISAACERDELVEGIIVGRVKGGLSVDIGVKAFLPGSQVDLRPVRNLDKLIGEKFKFKVIKFNKKRGNIVLSRRVLLEKEREELKKETLKNLEEGAVLKGVVKNLTDYGAFIDLGGIDGLLHVTDMTLGPHRPPERDVRGGRGDPRRGPQVRPGHRARQPGPQADPGGSVAPRRREVPGRHAGQGQGRQPHRLRRLHRARAGRRGPGPRLRDELDQAGQAPVQARQPGRRGRGRGARHRPEGQAHQPRHEADRAQPLDAARGQVPDRLGHPRRGPQRHRLRHLRRRRGGHRRPRARLRHLLDRAHQAPGREVQEGRRGRGGGAQHRRRERALQPRHQAARRPIPWTTLAERHPVGSAPQGQGHQGHRLRRLRRDRARHRGAGPRLRDEGRARREPPRRGQGGRRDRGQGHRHGPAGAQGGALDQGAQPRRRRGRLPRVPAPARATAAPASAT